MSQINPALDAAFAARYEQVYTCAFLLTRNEPAARATTLQTFLHLGAEKQEFPTERAAELALFGWLLHNCEDFYYRKLRRLPSKNAVAVSFPVSDELFGLLRQPLPRRTTFALHHVLGCTAEETASLMKKSPKAVAAFLPQGSSDRLLADLQKLPLSAEGKEQMESDLYLRFTERSVGVENALLQARWVFQRAAVVLAVLVLGLFAYAIYFATSFANGG